MVKRPKALYHYTSQAGLIGIVKSMKLWATSIRYLNDSREYNHDRDLLLSVIDDTMRTVSEPARDFLRFVRPPGWNIYPLYSSFQCPRQMTS
jgi:hypothetical protein